MKTDEDITALLAHARAGDPLARDQVVSALHRDLSRLARAKLAAESTLTNLDATALVNECWIRLAQGAPGRWEDRRAFLAYAAAAMRSVIVDVARERNAQKRGSGLRELTLSTGVAGEAFREHDLEQLDLALRSLQKVDARLLSIVEMRYFAGLTLEDIAAEQGIALATVKRKWQAARAFLLKELRA